MRGRAQSNGREREWETGSGENKDELMEINPIQLVSFQGQVRASPWGYHDDSVPSPQAPGIRGPDGALA